MIYEISYSAGGSKRDAQFTRSKRQAFRTARYLDAWKNPDVKVREVEEPKNWKTIWPEREPKGGKR